MALGAFALLPFVAQTSFVAAIVVAILAIGGLIAIFGDNPYFYKKEETHTYEDNDQRVEGFLEVVWMVFVVGVIIAVIS